MSPEARAIYARMPADAKARVDRIVDGAFKELTIKLWANAEKQRLIEERRKKPPEQQMKLPDAPPPDPEDDWRNR